MSEPPSMTQVFSEDWGYSEPPSNEQLWFEMWGYSEPTGIGEGIMRLLSSVRVLNAVRSALHHHLQPPTLLIPLRVNVETWSYSEPPSMTKIISESWSS